MFADDNFLVLCPDAVSRAAWCMSPPSDGVCCGICPVASISGIQGHMTLAFSSLSSTIAMSPESAPNALFTNLLQCNAYAISLLYYLLSDASGLDWFHAAYALMLALSCLIPLTAIAASPPWAVTGEESPQIRAAKQEQTIMKVLSALERRKDSSDSEGSSGDEKSALRKKRRKKKRARRMTREIVLRMQGADRGCCGISPSHMVLYVGFTGSVILWASCFWLGVVGGLTGSTRVSLAQPNCTEGLGGAKLLLYFNLGLMMLAVVVFVASVINPLVSDVADAVGRESMISCNSDPRLVFGLSFTVWLIWMSVSSYIYYLAASSNLLAAGEFSWSWASVFSALMVLLPVTSIVKTLWQQRYT